LLISVIISWAVVILAATIVATGLLSLVALIMKLSEKICDFIAESLKVHNEFRDFLWKKYIKKEIK
jgi:hypothetical protein